MMYPPQPPAYPQNYASTPGTGPPPSSRLMENNNNQYAPQQPPQYDNNTARVQQPHANAGAAVATNGIKLLASPSGGTGGNTISHRILTTHGATSEVF